MSTVNERRLQLKSVPWDAVRQLLWLIRRGYWNQPRPDGTYLWVDTDVLPIEKALGERYYHPNWELSAYYKGEDLNLTRAERDPYKGVVWRQTHVRGWEEDGGVSLSAHYEPAPSEHPDEHLTPSEYAEPQKGMNKLRGALDEAGFSYEEFHYG
jgi:hypothetical protein